MSDFLAVIGAGFLASLGMSLIMLFVRWSGFATGDMLRILGSLVTKAYGNSLGVGWMLYLTGGCIFAFFYYLIWSAIGISTLEESIYIGSIIGFFHGVCVSAMFAGVLSEHHPVKSFKQNGLNVAIAQVPAHLGFGVLMGTLLGLAFL